MNIIDTRLQWLDIFTQNIKEEDERQVAKWGIQDRHVFEWLAWTTEEFGEFVKAVNEFNYGRETTIIHVMKEGLQAVTLLLKMLEGFMNTTN